MASTYSTSLRLELIGQGEQSGTWGITTNNNFGSLVEQAITGVQTISMSNTTYTLTSFNGTVDEARNAVLLVAGTNLAPQNLVAPAVEKVYIVNNKSGNTVTIKTSGGNGVAVANNTTAQVFCDGTNFFSAAPTINNLTGNFAATGTITSGGAMTSGGTLTAPTLSVAGSGSLGTNLTVGGTTYTNALTNYGNQQVNGTQYVVGRISTSADIVSTGSTNYGSAQINGNLNVNGAISAGSIAGVTGIIKQAVMAQYPYQTYYGGGADYPTGHIAYITPTSASSKILVLLTATFAQQASSGNAYLTMVCNGRNLTGGEAIDVANINGGQIYVTVPFTFLDSPGTTATLAYQPYINADSGGYAFYNRNGNATLTLLEITQ